MPSPEPICSWEPLETLLDDGLADLVLRHWDEVGVHKVEMPLNPNWTEYQRLEDAGIVKILSCRVEDRLIGYNSFCWLPHLHYWGTQHALGDAIYVEPESRRTGAGVLLIDQAERDLPAMAPKRLVRIVYHDKAFLEYLGPVLSRRGYTHQENIWDKIVRA